MPHTLQSQHLDSSEVRALLRPPCLNRPWHRGLAGMMCTPQGTLQTRGAEHTAQVLTQHLHLLPSRLSSTAGGCGQRHLGKMPMALLFLSLYLFSIMWASWCSYQQGWREPGPERRPAPGSVTLAEVQGTQAAGETFF